MNKFVTKKQFLNMKFCSALNNKEYIKKSMTYFSIKLNQAKREIEKLDIIISTEKPRLYNKWYSPAKLWMARDQREKLIEDMRYYKVTLNKLYRIDAAIRRFESRNS